MTSSAEGIREDVDSDGTLKWTLCNEARRNAIGPGALRWIETRCAELHGEIVVISGAGDEAFCAGFDLTALAAVPDGMPDATLIAASTAMSRADATFIAAIGGYAIGAGVELVSACDLRLARDDVWFKVPAATLGVVYHAKGIRRLRDVFGRALCDRLLLLGDKVEAQVAFDGGALHAIAPRDELAGLVADVVGRLRMGSPHALRGNRDFLRAVAQGRVAEHASAHDRARQAAYEAMLANLDDG